MPDYDRLMRHIDAANKHAVSLANRCNIEGAIKALAAPVYDMARETRDLETQSDWDEFNRWTMQEGGRKWAQGVDQVVDTITKMCECRPPIPSAVGVPRGRKPFRQL